MKNLKFVFISILITFLLLVGFGSQYQQNVYTDEEWPRQTKSTDSF